MATTPKTTGAKNETTGDHRPRDWYNHICITCGTHDCEKMREHIDGPKPTKSQDADN